MSQKWDVDVEDDIYTLYRGNEVIIETNHDDVGWAGVDLLEKLARELNKRDY